MDQATPHELSVLSILLPLAGIVFIIVIGVVLMNQHFRKNLFKQMLTQEELKILHQQALLESSIEVQERERKRVAQDLHDELGASLSIARMHLIQLEESDEESALRTPLRNIRNLTENALASMRRISHELMPPQLETFGLVRTLESVAAQTGATGKLEIRTHVRGHFPRLPWIVELGVYRMTMELINNTIKHAHANKIDIVLSLEGERFVLRYSDDGRGIVEKTDSHGLGLKNLEARTSSLKGSFTTENGPGVGFSATVTIPLNVTSYAG
jgi:signal transduction histidine kinase